MNENTSNKVIPSEFYKTSNFFTLNGAAGAVWIFCLVLANFFSEDILTPKSYRVIALILSEVIAIIMLIRIVKKNKIENWLFTFFNGLLIFINASGLNAISSNLIFENRDSIKKEQTKVQESSFISDFFSNDISWWIEDSYYKEKINLLNKNKLLNQEINEYSQMISELKLQNKNLIKTKDSLILKTSLKEKLFDTNKASDKKLVTVKIPKNNIEGVDKLNKKIEDLRKYNSSMKVMCQEKIKMLESELSKYKKLEKSRYLKLGDTPYSTLVVELDRLRKKLIECESKFDKN